MRVCPVRPVGLFFLASHHGRCDAGSTRIYSVRWLLVDLDVLVFVGSVLFGCADSTRDVTAWDAVLCVCVLSVVGCRVSLLRSLSFALPFLSLGNDTSNRFESNLIVFYSLFSFSCVRNGNPLVVYGYFICCQSTNIFIAWRAKSI